MAFADERAVAEEGLARLSSAPSAVLPPVAMRIRDARLRLGITEAEVAHRWGVEPSLYWDLELHDDELFTSVDFRRLPGLAAALELPLMVLLFGDEPETKPPEVGYAEVAAVSCSPFVKTVLREGIPGSWPTRRPRWAGRGWPPASRTASATRAPDGAAPCGTPRTSGGELPSAPRPTPSHGSRSARSSSSG